MRKWFLLVLVIIGTWSAKAQESAATHVLAMNKLITGFAGDKSGPLVLYQQTGTIEQNQNNYISRIKLADIGNITVMPFQGGFSVNIYCQDSGQCVNLIRPNGNNSTVTLAVYIFTIDGAANAFAEQTHQLAKIFVGDTHPLLLKLFVSPEGKTNILRPKEKVIASEPATIQQEGEDNEAPPATQPIAAKPPVKAAPPVKNTQEDMDEDGDLPKSNPAPNQKKVDKQQDQEDANVEPKPAKKNTKATKKEARDEEVTDSNDEPKESKPARKSKTATAQDSEEKEEPVIEKSNDICEQIMQVIQSGKTKRFADLEGKVLNEQNKTNESRLKLKGAKRNYLSNYKNKRAFMAEYKVLTDNELIMIEFDKLQTQLEDCLDGNWDNEDRSGDDEYADLQGDVRDVEYKNTNDPTAPSMRIIMLSDGKKYVLFVRFQLP